MKIIAVSDTHCRLRKINIPFGDLLIHGGDLTFKGDVQEISQELRELGRIAKNFKYGCVFVAGNHDWLGERQPALMKQMALDEGLTYLDHESIEINGIKIFGSAYTPAFCNWAFNVDRAELKEYWDEIPNDIDILVTHGPPQGILDAVPKVIQGEFIMDEVGDLDLFNKLITIPTLKHHFFGHIHYSYGHKEFMGKHFWNVSICDEQYKPINEPVQVDFEKTTT